MRFFVGIVLALATGAAGMWFYQTRVATDQISTSSRGAASEALNQASTGEEREPRSNGLAGKYLCSGLTRYEFKDDGTFYAWLGRLALGPGTAGTYTIDGERLILNVQGQPPQVSYLRNGKFSILGSGQDCLLEGSHEAIASGAGKYSCRLGGVIFEFQWDDTVYVNDRAIYPNRRYTANYEIFGRDVIVYVNEKVFTLTFENGTLSWYTNEPPCVKGDPRSK